MTATSGTTIFLEWSVSVNINGETTILSGSSKSDELPVRQGDEVEIRFILSCPENTEANFIFPDGISATLNVSNPTFKWVVPDNFSNGMLIRGETHYETEDAIYNLSGEITLKSIVI